MTDLGIKATVIFILLCAWGVSGFSHAVAVLILMGVIVSLTYTHTMNQKKRYRSEPWKRNREAVRGGALIAMRRRSCGK